MDTKTNSSFKRLFNPALSGSLYYLFTFLCAGAYMPFLYVYLAELGLNGGQIGFLSILNPAMTMLLATTISSLADRKRWRVITGQIALTGTAVSLFFLQMPSTFGMVVLLMLVLAIFNSPLMSITESLIARMAQRHDLNYGSMRLWGSFGFAVSSLGFGALWQRFGFKSMFTVASLLFLPLVLIASLLEEGPVIARDERKPASQLLRDSGLLLLLLATLLASVSNSLSMTFAGVYARALGGGNFLIGMMTAFGALAELPMMFFSERVARRIRGPNTVLLSFAIMAVAFLGYILTTNPAFLPPLAFFRGLGYGLWIPITVRIVTERTPQEWASTAQSMLTICLFGLPTLIAGPLGGWIYDAVSPAAVFGLGIVSLVLASGVLAFASVRGKL